MDISSLPEEILSKVLKRANFGTVMKLRKINQKIDKIARRNRICEKVPVRALSFGDEYGNLCGTAFLDKTDLSDFGLKKAPTTMCYTGSLSTLIEKFLSKFEVCRTIQITNLHIGEKDLKALHAKRHNLRNVTQLVLKDLQLNISEDGLKTLFMEVFPNLNTLMFVNIVCFTQALSVRKWKELNLFQNIYRPPLQINRGSSKMEFLRIVAQCQEVDIYGPIKTELNLSDVVELIKKCLTADGEFNRKFNLGEVEIGREKVEETMKFNFPGINITKENSVYTVFFGIKDVAYVEFSILN